MENIKQHDHRTTRRPDCVTEIRMGNTVLVVSGFFARKTPPAPPPTRCEGTGSGSRCYTKKAI